MFVGFDNSYALCSDIEHESGSMRPKYGYDTSISKISQSYIVTNYYCDKYFLCNYL